VSRGGELKEVKEETAGVGNGFDSNPQIGDKNKGSGVVKISGIEDVGIGAVSKLKIEIVLEIWISQNQWNF